jgi:hypothetical protein
MLDDAPTLTTTPLIVATQPVEPPYTSVYVCALKLAEVAETIIVFTSLKFAIVIFIINIYKNKKSTKIGALLFNYLKELLF